MRSDPATPGRLRIELHDAEISLVALVPVTGDVPEAVALNQHALGDALRGAKGGVDVDVAGSAVTIRSHGGVPALLLRYGKDLATHYAAPRPLASTVTASLPALAFRGALSCAAASMSNEETRYYLNGVYFDRGTPERSDASGYQTLVATDGYRMTYAILAVDQCLPPFIMPRESVKTVLSLLRKEGASHIRVTVGDDNFKATAFHVTGEDWEVWGRPVNGFFPDWRRVVPARAAGASIPAQSLIDAVSSMVKSFCRDLEEHSSRLRVTLSPDAARVETTDARDMSAAWSVTTAGLTNPVHFGVDQKYLLESVKALNPGKTEAVLIWQAAKDEPIGIQLPGTGRAAVIGAIRSYD
jgi:DNA polymerase-3 subunit beta